MSKFGKTAPMVIYCQVSARIFRILVFFSLVDNKHTFLFVSTTFCVPVGSCILYPGVSGYRECVVFNTTFHELVAGAITLWSQYCCGGGEGQKYTISEEPHSHVFLLYYFYSFFELHVLDQDFYGCDTKLFGMWFHCGIDSKWAQWEWWAINMMVFADIFSCRFSVGLPLAFAHPRPSLVFACRFLNQDFTSGTQM